MREPGPSWLNCVWTGSEPGEQSWESRAGRGAAKRNKPGSKHEVPRGGPEEELRFHSQSVYWRVKRMVRLRKVI